MTNMTFHLYFAQVAKNIKKPNLFLVFLSHANLIKT